MESQELLTVSTALGYSILRHGAETYRVEESIRRICCAYGYRDADVFVIPSSIVVTIEDGRGGFLTKTRRITSRNTDLDKVDKLNDLSRRICKQCPDYFEAMEELNRIEQEPNRSFGVQLLGYGMVSAFFTLFYGGSFVDSCTAFVIGALLRVLLKQLEKLGSSAVFTNIMGGGFTALMCSLTFALGISQSVDKMTIGILMNLVPGIALTNAMREFIASDLISGMIKLLEALLTAVSIAIGVMLSLAYLTPLLEGLLR